jgi:hypothetical protein
VPRIDHQGLVRSWPAAHTATVTITYASGAVLQAIVLSHDVNEIRAIAAGCDDVLEFTRVHDTWISGELEPVTIEFACQRRQTCRSISEDDCLCPKELSARLIAMVVSGCELGEAGKDILLAFSAEDSRVPIQRTARHARLALRQGSPLS